MRRIEFTESYKINGQQFEAGDRKSFEDGKAEHYINIGVAKDPETGEQGERKPGVHVLQVDSVLQKPDVE